MRSAPTININQTICLSTEITGNNYGKYTSKYTNDVEGIAVFAAPKDYSEDTGDEKVVFMKPHEFIVEEDRLTQFMAPLYNVQEPWKETLIEEQRRLI